MAIEQVMQTRLPIEDLQFLKSHTLFTPPGIFIETARYPILNAGVLASPYPLETLSIYDHPESWRGLGRDAILAMRRHLYSIVIPVNAREMQPKQIIDSLQTIALSVNPVALGVEVEGLPPRHLYSSEGQLPAGPVVKARSLEILSKPEISRVAQKITDKDIPAAEGIWKLFEYDYSLEQITRILAVGLLGMKKNRRMMTIRSAYRIVIDTYINEVIMNLIDQSQIEDFEIYIGKCCNDSFTILASPGESRVDYIRLEKYGPHISRGVSIDDPKLSRDDSRAGNFANFARYSAFRHLLKKQANAHLIIFHHTAISENQIITPWIARAGTHDALSKDPIVIQDLNGAIEILDSILPLGLKTWVHDTPLINRVKKHLVLV